MDVSFWGARVILEVKVWWLRKSGASTHGIKYRLVFHMEKQRRVNKDDKIERMVVKVASGVLLVVLCDLW